MRALWTGLVALVMLTAVTVGVHAQGAGSLSGMAHRTVKATTVGGQFAFSPKTVTVKVGTKVTWTNPSGVDHTVTGKGAWHFNKQLPAGGSVSYVFKKAGTYHYYCAIHPFMTAKVIVK